MWYATVYHVRFWILLYCNCHTCCNTCLYPLSHYIHFMNVLFCSIPFCFHLSVRVAGYRRFFPLRGPNPVLLNGRRPGYTLDESPAHCRTLTDGSGCHTRCHLHIRSNFWVPAQGWLWIISSLCQCSLIFLWLSATPSCFSPVSMYPYVPCVHSLLLSLLVLLFIFPEHVSVSLLFPISLSPHGLFSGFYAQFLSWFYSNYILVVLCLAFIFWISLVLLFTLCCCLSFGFWIS